MSGAATSPNQFSTLLRFQLCPSAVKLVDCSLRFVQLSVCAQQFLCVAGNRWMFSGRALLLQRLFGFCKALLDRCKLAGFKIRKLLLCRRLCCSLPRGICFTARCGSKLAAFSLPVFPLQVVSKTLCAAASIQ